MNIVKLHNDDAAILLKEAAEYAERNEQYRDAVIILSDPSMSSDVNMQVFVTQMDTIKIAGMCACAPQTFFEEQE